MIDAIRTPKRGRKACTECRQQKTRCDVSLDLSKPCSRCKKLNHECIVSDPFKRENKRQKLDTLEHETTKLREQLQLFTQGHNTDSVVRSDNTTEHRLNIQDGFQQAAGHLTEHLVTFEEEALVVSDKTVSRSLSGSQVEASEINDMFRLYFADFAYQLPILRKRTPNVYYQRSATLFWAIIGAACRVYEKNSTLFGSLRAKVIDIVIDSLKGPPSLEGVQAMLLVVNWPFPRTTSLVNPAFALTGALLHSAMAIGLHIPAAGQEFSKVKLRLTEEDICQRADTWAYCVIVYQRTCLWKGNTTLTLRDLCQEPAQRRLLSEKLDITTRHRQQVQDIVARLGKALSEGGLQELTSEQEQSLDIIISAFEVELEIVQNQGDSLVDRLDMSIARLSCRAFHLFKSPANYEALKIIRMLDAACRVVADLDAAFSFSSSGLKACSFYYCFALLVAVQILLRICKTRNLAAMVDTSKGKSSIYRAINLSKSMSVVNNDTIARMSEVTAQLMESEKAFKHPFEPETIVPLRVRSRMAMSIVLDGTMWWREEFGGTTGLYPIPLVSSTRRLIGEVNAVPEPTSESGVLPSQIEAPPLDFSYNDMVWTSLDDIFSPFWMDQNSLIG